MDKEEIMYWIKELRTMNEDHYPALDHKDCGEIAELLYSLMLEVEVLEVSGKVHG